MRKKKILKILGREPPSRYLPGQVDEAEERRDHNIYVEHRINVMCAKPKIDNKPPKFIPEIFLKSQRLCEDADRMRMIDKENLDLIKNINIIFRTKGKVDCWNPETLYKLIMDNQQSENMKLMKANRKIRKAIAKRETIYSRKEFLRDWKRIETTLAKIGRYPLIWKDPRIVKETDSIVVDKKLSSAKNHSRPRCFFDIELQNTREKLGRIVFELYSDFVPRTCANFEAFCRGHNGLSYKGTSFFNILPGYWCQGGDVTKYNGTGGTSIYGESFQDENFNLRHARTGVLSMWSNGEHTNNSKFNLTFGKLRTMNGKRVVFGKVIKGLRNLFKIEELGAKSGKPLKTVVVGKCGVLDERKQSLTWSIEHKDSQMIELKEEQQSV